MTQPRWHRRARELFPEMLPPGKAARSLHDFCLDLFEVAKSGTASADFLDRAMRFVEEGLSSRSPSVRCDVVEGFLRHAATDNSLRQKVAFHGVLRVPGAWDLLADSLPDEEIQSLLVLIRDEQPR